MASRPRGSTKSSNPRTTGDINKTPGGPRPARAQRNDTPEAKEQNRRSPKTHPTRAAGSRRQGSGGRDR